MSCLCVTQWLASSSRTHWVLSRLTWKLQTGICSVFSRLNRLIEFWSYKLSFCATFGQEWTGTLLCLLLQCEAEPLTVFEHVRSIEKYYVHECRLARESNHWIRVAEWMRWHVNVAEHRNLLNLYSEFQVFHVLWGFVALNPFACCHHSDTANHGLSPRQNCLRFRCEGWVHSVRRDI